MGMHICSGSIDFPAALCCGISAPGSVVATTSDGSALILLMQAAECMTHR